MMKRPPIPVLSVSIGAALLPLLGGKFGQEQGVIEPGSSVMSAVINGSLPFSNHFFISLFFLIPLLHALFTKRIIHVPNIRITGWLAAFFTLISCSLVFSSFISVTVVSILEWGLMSSAYFAVASVSGRKQGLWVLFGLFAGLSLSAVGGVMEYGQERLYDPGYRIFAGFVGPNQAAPAFGAGICLGLALLFLTDRIPRLLVLLGIVIQGLALVLTQSKGGLLCLPIGLLVFLVLCAVVSPKQIGKTVGTVAIPLLLIAVMAFGAQKSAQSATASPSAVIGSRFSNSSESNVQSAGFRKLLWQSAIDLTKMRPYGWGLGTYQFESTRSGRMTQTTLTHQTFLQLGAEASMLSPLFLLVFLGMSVIRGLKGIKNMPVENRWMLIGTTSSLALLIAHNMVDSDMYVYGLGGMVFLLTGIMTSSSPDSQSPEVVFPMPKFSVAFATMIIAPMCLSLAYGEQARAKTRGFLAARQPEEALQSVNHALSTGFADGFAHALRAIVKPSEEDLLAAASLHPSPKNYRALAYYYFAVNKTKEAYRCLNRALDRDPNNAPALLAYFKNASQAGDIELAKRKAELLLETEVTTYYKVRSQPELIPTQTFEARLFLASVESDKAKKIAFYKGAIEGLAKFRTTTVPVVRRLTAYAPDARIGDDDRDSVVDKLTKGQDACKDLLKLVPQGSEDYRFATEELAAFAAALAESLK